MPYVFSEVSLRFFSKKDEKYRYTYNLPSLNIACFM